MLGQQISYLFFVHGDINVQITDCIVPVYLYQVHRSLSSCGPFYFQEKHPSGFSVAAHYVKYML